MRNPSLVFLVCCAHPLAPTQPSPTLASPPQSSRPPCWVSSPRVQPPQPTPMGLWLPGRMQSLRGCSGIPNHPRGPVFPGLRTPGSHQDRGWAPTQWCGYWGGCLGPSAAPCHPLPSPEARSSLSDLLQTCWGQGRIVPLHSGRRGLGGRGETQTSPGLWQPHLCSPVPLCPYSPGNLQCWGTQAALGSP